MKDPSLNAGLFVTSLLSFGLDTLQLYDSETNLYSGCTHGDLVSSCAYFYDEANRIKRNLFMKERDTDYEIMILLVCAFILIFMTATIIVDIVKIYQMKTFLKESSALYPLRS